MAKIISLAGTGTANHFRHLRHVGATFMKILITGICGFAGGALASELRQLDGKP